MEESGDHPDGRRLLSGSDGPAVLWDAATGDPITRIEPAGTATSTIALSGDGQVMMIGGVYDDVYLWDLVENRALERLRQGNDSWVSAVAITADGRWAFSATGKGASRCGTWTAAARSGSTAVMATRSCRRSWSRPTDRVW